MSRRRIGGVVYNSVYRVYHTKDIPNIDYGTEMISETVPQYNGEFSRDTPVDVTGY
jgi:hypothetical protein